MFHRILVAIDGSAPSRRGFDLALDLAKDQGASLHAVHVVDSAAVVSGLAGSGYAPATSIDRLIEDLRASGRKTLSKAEGTAAKRGVALKTVLVDLPGQSVAHAILVQARKLRADLIVMGTHGRRGLRRLVVGSDAEGVLREARVPVLLVRGLRT